MFLVCTQCIQYNVILYCDFCTVSTLNRIQGSTVLNSNNNLTTVTTTAMILLLNNVHVIKTIKGFPPKKLSSRYDLGVNERLTAIYRLSMYLQPRRSIASRDYDLRAVSPFS